MFRSLSSRIAFAVVLVTLSPAVAWGTEASAAPPDNEGVVADSADVVIDGERLFRVRGITSIPARERAEVVRQRIIALADDETIPADSGRIEERPPGLAIVYGDVAVVILMQEDAALEQIGLPLLADTSRTAIARGIERYREAREPEVLLQRTAWLLGLTLITALAVYAIRRLFGWFDGVIERNVKSRIERLDRASSRLVDAAQLWAWFGGALRLVRTIINVVIVLLWLNTALGLFPWTRPFAKSVFEFVLDPLRSMGTGLLASLPDIAFLIVLAFVVRFVLNAAKAFFERVEHGRIQMRSFERDWASPTYRLVRIAIIAFSLVVAYPYIPGSDSDAFKGVSLFLGILFSLGSTSFIANIIAGYSLTYRRAYHNGDRVQIGEYTGDIVDTRVLVTRMRSVKNEEINIPNSMVISSAIVNYTTLAKDPGLILHTEVSIGYDVSWRQVHAMLLMAADRTEGLMKQPPPFVLQRALGDFTVVYQLNAYCDDASRMGALYSAMHGYIQDVFNEYGVQIMSPNYEADPGAPKIVPPDAWYVAPAKAPGLPVDPQAAAQPT